MDAARDGVVTRGAECVVSVEDVRDMGLGVVTSITVGRLVFKARVVGIVRLVCAIMGRTKRGLEVSITLPRPPPTMLPPPQTPPALTTTDPTPRDNGELSEMIVPLLADTPIVLVMTMEGLASRTPEAEVTLVSRNEAAEVLGLPE